MKFTLTLLIALFCFIVTQSFQCDRGINQQCDTYKTDTVLLNVSIVNAAAEYRLYDTIWLSSIVNDNFTPLSGSPALFTKSIDQLNLTVMPYSINTAGTLPILQYANIEFNPVVREGSLQNPGYNGYNYIFRRVAPNNNLQAGLVAGRTGLYLVEINHGNYYGGSFNIYNGNDHCTSYNGQSAMPLSQQNRNYWTLLGVTAISIGSNYGSKTVSINNRNYFIIRVIP
jgi:hypothetical protein